MINYAPLFKEAAERNGMKAAIPYLEDVFKAAAVYVKPEQVVEFATDMLAIIEQESVFGTLLKPVGPAGTGDFIKRNGKLPANGEGWGKGLCQIDQGAHQAFLSEVMPDGSPKWKDAYENILYGSKVYWQCCKAFPDNKKAAIAAYNTGAGNVRKSLKAGLDPQTTTHGGTYVTKVLVRRKKWE